MGRSPSQRKSQAAWDRIEALGGHGVWEREMVVVCLADTRVTDDDLELFRDFPFVQTLDLSRTAVGDQGLVHLAGLQALERLIIVGCKISRPALEKFHRDHPSVAVISEPLPKKAVNPFTGKPF